MKVRACGGGATNTQWSPPWSTARPEVSGPVHRQRCNGSSTPRCFYGAAIIVGGPAEVSLDVLFARHLLDESYPMDETRPAARGALLPMRALQGATRA